MAVNINLKEIFTTDDQTDLAEKLNFNFNRLIALGVGEKGTTGAKGDAGGPGPRGKTGLPGKNGSIIWSTSGSVYIDLSTSSPEDSVVGDYYIGKVTVGSVAYNGIYRKESTGTVWGVVTDFSEVFRDALDTTGGELFPWRVGINTQVPAARIVIPINSSQGLDRKIVTQLSKPGDYYETYTPNWVLNTETTQNSQAIIFNFDVNTVKRIIAGSSPDANGYNVEVSTNRLGANISQLNEAFPYTSMLSLYSFYTASDASVLPDHLIGTTGYRHQLELGSVDDITEYLHTSDAANNYVISPTYQNLRVRKYRLSAADLPGKGIIATDFVLHSTDSVTDPALSSKFTWSINKKTNSLTNKNTIIKMGLSSSTLESSSAGVGLTGISVDGIHMSLAHPSTTYLFALGFDPSNYSNATKNMIARSNGSIDTIVFDKIGVAVQNLTNKVTLNSNGVSAGSGTDLTLYASDATKEIKLGSSDSNIALKIKNNRLSSAIPFAISIGAVPTHSSTDVNTLDEYQEGAFVPSVYYGTLPTPAAGVLTNSSPTITNQLGVYVKIGKLVSFTLTFAIKAWTIVSTTGRTSPPYLVDPYSNVSSVNVGNLANSPDGTWTNDQHELGNESYPILIRNLPDHWPTPNESENIVFNVSIKPKVYNGYAMRPFEMAYSWTDGGTSNSTNTWKPIIPSSVKARFATYEDGTTKPQLKLYGNRIDNTGLMYNTFESLVSVYDFLNYVHPTNPTNGNETYVTISGVYETNHQTAEGAHPIGITSTTTTSTSTTTTTTAYVGPTTTTTSTSTTSTTTTTTATPTTTTTTTSLYGPELMYNSGNSATTDWISTSIPGLGDGWSTYITGFPIFSIINALYGFTNNAQQMVRQSTKTGGLGIMSNALGIGSNSNNYLLTLKYRASHQILVVVDENSSVPGLSIYDIVIIPPNTSSTASTVSIPFNCAGNQLDAIGFIMKDDGASGSTIWLQLDEVSLKLVL